MVTNRPAVLTGHPSPPSFLATLCHCGSSPRTPPPLSGDSASLPEVRQRRRLRCDSCSSAVPPPGRSAGSLADRQPAILGGGAGPGLEAAGGERERARAQDADAGRWLALSPRGQTASSSLAIDVACGLCGGCAPTMVPSFQRLIEAIFEIQVRADWTDGRPCGGRRWCGAAVASPE